MNPDSKYATVTEQGRATVGGLVDHTDETRAKATKYVRRQGFPAIEEDDLMKMLGLTEPGFEWVGTPHHTHTRKQVRP